MKTSTGYLSKALITASISIFNFNANALVSSPSSVEAGAWNLELKSTFERGKIEPNENRASYQSAEIDIHQISLSKGIEGLSLGMDHYLRIDLKSLKSGREEVAGQLFYEADSGEALTLTGGFNVTHEPTYKAGFYVSLTPLADLNKDKFSIPRIDIWSLGFKSFLELNSRFFVEDSLHYGSGLPGHQNSYLALTHLFAYRLNSDGASPLVLKWGPYAELDTSERRDNKYDAVFSPSGNQDRIRSMKVGVVYSFEFGITESTFGAMTYVQKLGGYDAPATNAISLSLGTHF